MPFDSMKCPITRSNYVDPFFFLIRALLLAADRVASMRLVHHLKDPGFSNMPGQDPLSFCKVFVFSFFVLLSALKALIM